ncbi:MAG: ABC transporter ATP-binding protein [Acetobacteraceae bacterium]|nr:ABC transporter ATP-binding protein [Acetobacteraceae bacterium]
MTQAAEDVLLDVTDLHTRFRSGTAVARAVDRVSFTVGRGETLAIVGESGSGKSVTALSIMRLIERPGEIAGGSAWFRNRAGDRIDLLQASERVMRRTRGDEIAMIFQEPMSSLNPLLTVGEQIGEVIRLHRGLGRAKAAQQAVDLLNRVHVPDAERRAGDYPHRLSGGMRQRVMIAMALSCSPTLLIADEPTTALDVTIQAQILDLMRELQTQTAMSMLFITHNLSVVAEIADCVAVMYAGRIVEQGAVAAVFASPLHPYTRALLGSLPTIARNGRDRSERLVSIPGQVPSPIALPRGCAFAPRCPMAAAQCAEMPPLENTGNGHTVRCWRWREA